MKRTAFIDIESPGGGTVRIFGNGGPGESVPFDLDGSLGVHAAEIPADVEDCWLSLPLQMLNFRVLELPLTEMDRVREVLPFQLEGLILGPTKTFVMDAVPLGPGGGANKVLAVYIEKSVLRKLLNEFGALGLDPRTATSLELGLIMDVRPSEEELADLLVTGPSPRKEQRGHAALKEMSESTMDLRRGELSFTRETERARRGLKVTVAVLLALSLLVAGDLGLRTFQVKKETAALERSITRAYAEMFPGDRAADPKGITYKIQSRLTELRQKEAAFRGVSPLTALMDLGRAVPPGVVLTDITLDGEHVVLRGEAPSLSDVQKLKGNLESMLADVKISRTEQSAANRFVFTVNATEDRE